MEFKKKKLNQKTQTTKSNSILAGGRGDTGMELGNGV